MTRTFDGGRPRPRHRSFFAGSALGLAALALVTQPASAENKTWVGGVGNWDSAAGWSPAGQPGATDSVFVSSSAAADAVLTYVNPSNPLTNIFSEIQVNGAGSRLATLVQAQNVTLNANQMFVGDTGRGAVQLTGGALNLLEPAGLTIGRQDTGNGAFTLGGSAVLTVTAQVVVGESGTGAFTQTGGRLIVTGMAPQPGMPAPATGSLAIAGDSGAVGTFNLGGGSVEAGSVQLAPIGGSATVNHSGGSLAPTADLSVGDPQLPGLTGQALYDHTGGGVTTPVLNIGSTGRFRQAGGSLRVNSLAIDLAGGKLDLTQNMVLDYTGTSPLATVRNYVKTGYAGGTWGGNGIITSAGAGAAVGYAEASELLGLTGGNQGTWNGQQVDATSLLLRYTLAGDATLDGVVDFNDLVKLAQNYNISDGLRRWTVGDFTYDGNVDFNDLVKLAQNYNTAAPAAGAVAGAPAGFSGDLAAAFASVPEPGSAAALVGAAGAVLMRRRRRA